LDALKYEQFEVGMKLSSAEAVVLKSEVMTSRDILAPASSQWICSTEETFVDGECEKFQRHSEPLKPPPWVKARAKVEDDILTGSDDDAEKPKKFALSSKLHKPPPWVKPPQKLKGRPTPDGSSGRPITPSGVSSPSKQEDTVFGGQVVVAAARLKLLRKRITVFGQGGGGADRLTKSANAEKTNDSVEKSKAPKWLKKTAPPESASSEGAEFVAEPDEKKPVALEAEASVELSTPKNPVSSLSRGSKDVTPASSEEKKNGLS